MTRPSKKEWLMSIAIMNAVRSSCSRRKVGAVITDRNHYILSCGYNGPPSGMPNCGDSLSRCEGKDAASGTDLDMCQAIHAEQNAIARLRAANEACALYVTTEPCISCAKVLSATPIQHVYFLQKYPHSDFQTYWKRCGRQSYHLELTPWLSLLSDILGTEAADSFGL